MKQGLKKKSKFEGSIISDKNLALFMCQNFPEIAAESLLLSLNFEEAKERTIRNSVRKALHLGYIKKTRDPIVFIKTELGRIHF